MTRPSARNATARSWRRSCPFSPSRQNPHPPPRQPAPAAVAEIRAARAPAPGPISTESGVWRGFPRKLWYPACDNPRKVAESPRSARITPVLTGGFMDRRRTARVCVQLPVNVWGVDAFGQAVTSPAMVTNMSSTAVVLQGVRRRMRVGEALDLRMGDHKGQFRVIWIGEMADLGLEKIAGTSFLPAASLGQFSQAAASC